MIYGTYYLNTSLNFKTTQKNLADKSNFKASSEPFTMAPAKVRETANSRKAGNRQGYHLQLDGSLSHLLIQ